MKKLATTAALLLSACVSIPAFATSIVGATEIKITSAIPDYLQVAELEAFNLWGTNVAQALNGGMATGSSTYSSFSTPDKAIDGKEGGNYYSDTIFHSAGTSGAEFLDVRFAASDLSSVMIFGRTDCCTARDVYNIQIFNAAGKSLFSGKLDASGGSAGVGFSPAQVAEPAGLALSGIGLALAGAAARSRRKAANA